LGDLLRGKFYHYRRGPEGKQDGLLSILRETDKGEKMCDLDGAMDEFEKLKAERDRMRWTVEYYADMDLWDKDKDGYWVHAGRGPRRAQEILAGKEGG